MKRILSLLLICSVCISHAQTQQYKETVITDAPFPMKPIKEFIFPDREFPITKYGAKSDGKTLCTKAFQKAMAACNKAGGGYVVVPQGKWLTGAIHFKSNCNLRLEEGAVVEYSVLMPGAVVEAGAEVRFAILGENACVKSGAKVGTAPDGTEGWGVATVGPDVTVGRDAVVAAGAMLYDDVEAVK